MRSHYGQSGRPIEHDGRTQSVTAWARMFGLKPVTLYARLFRYGMSMDEALHLDPQRDRGGTWYKVAHDGQYEHRAIVERLIGMKLPRRARVHHVNENRRDNRPENLVVCNDDAHHMLIHYRQRAYDGSGDANNLRCEYCKTWDSPERIRVIYRADGSARRYHQACNTNYHNERRRKLRTRGRE